MLVLENELGESKVQSQMFCTCIFARLQGDSVDIHDVRKIY